MEYFYSKYTGEELEERLDRIDDIPELLAEMLTGKNYTTPEDTLCIVKKYVPTIYENIPIDNNTIYWANTNDGKVLKARIKLSDTDTDTEGECLWEKKVDNEGKEYLYSKLPVVTQYGVTMYAGTEGLDIAGIYDGLPIDNTTIYWDIDSNGNKVLKAIGSSSGGGVADSVAWANVIDKPAWLLDNRVSYSEIEGTPDLSNYVVKSYVDDNFVTFTLDEVITGIKSFTNGLKIGESLIKQLQEDVVYIDANLVVRGGVTMYYDDGEVDIPNIKDQIGPAGYNEKGLASFDQTYFTINNGHVSLIEGAVGLNEDELLNYLTNNQYAKKSDIPSLSGYATQSWVESKGFALNSDLTILSTKVNDFLEGSDTDTIINKWKELESFLTGLSQSDNLATILSTKADKTDLVEYIPIKGYTEIVGEKNFTGGLKVNGNPIYYDTEKKYWKLEGDLLVTGGVTMYGNEGTFTPSTIMDAILYDDSTLGINANGELYVKGGMGDVSGDYLPLSGGVMTGWIGLPKGTAIYDGNTYTLFGFNPSGDDLFVGHNLHNLTIRSYDTTIQTRGDSLRHYNINTGVTSTILDSSNWSQYITAGDGGSYLPLSGGTLTNTLTIDNSTVGLILHRSGQATPYIRFGQDTNNEWGELGVYNDGRLVFWPLVSSQGGYGQWNTIWHSGNDGSGSGLDADLLDGKHYSDIINGNVASATRIQAYTHDSGEKVIISGSRSDNTFTRKIYDNGWALQVSWQDANGVVHNGNIASLNDNVASATKLQTARTIWGQSFDGTGDIGNKSGSDASSIHIVDNRNDGVGGYQAIRFYYNTENQATIHYFHNNYNGFAWTSKNINIDTDHITFGDWSSPTMIVNRNTGNVGIGTTNPLAKLQVEGLVKINASSYGVGLEIVKDVNDISSINLASTSTDLWQISARYTSSENGNLKIYYYDGSTWANPLSINKSGNILVSGGITMYSARKLKNITDERGLSLDELSVIKPTRFTWKDGRDNKIHIGGIADDVHKVLPEVIYKADNDTLTMDYGNAAFAIAASLIKPVVNHEERIRLLEDENKRLKEEIEILKCNIA